MHQISPASDVVIKDQWWDKKQEINNAIFALGKIL
jgi:hypothetical protein